MLKAYLKYWKQYVNFGGKSTRPDYWWVFLLNTIMILAFCLLLSVVIIRFLIALDHQHLREVWENFKDTYYSNVRDSAPFHAKLFPVLDFLVHYSRGTLGLLWLSFFWKLANFSPRYALLVRRLRDSGLHWSWFFLRLVPGLLVLLATFLTFEPVFMLHSMRLLDASLIFLGISLALLLLAKLFVLVISLRASK